MKCKTCRQELPVLDVGDIVENTSTGQLGVIPEQLAVRGVMGRAGDYQNGDYWVPVILLTGGTSCEPLGFLTRWSRTNVRRVHGSFRITGRE